MIKRKFGNSGLEVSSLGLGCMGLSLQENLGAAEIKLAENDLKAINSAVSQVEVQGARYPEHLQNRVGR